MKKRMRPRKFFQRDQPKKRRSLVQKLTFYSFFGNETKLTKIQKQEIEISKLKKSLKRDSLTILTYKTQITKLQLLLYNYTDETLYDLETKLGNKSLIHPKNVLAEQSKEKLLEIKKQLLNQKLLIKALQHQITYMKLNEENYVTFQKTTQKTLV